jgi:hypothetical protein
MKDGSAVALTPPADPGLERGERTDDVDRVLPPGTITSS